MERTGQRREICSFVRRQGRITTSQQHALEAYWPRFGIDYEARCLDLSQVFGREAPSILEIGFGNGDSLAASARQYPDINYLGVEVHRPGVGRLLARLAADGIDNVRIISHDVMDVLRQQIPDNSLHGVYLFFPDPWPKKRHHKRRLVQGPFVALLASKLKDHGIFHMATDWQDYADHALAVLAAMPVFNNLSPTGRFCERPQNRVVTKFERRGQRLGHGVWDLMFERCAR